MGGQLSNFGVAFIRMEEDKLQPREEQQWMICRLMDILYLAIGGFLGTLFRYILGWLIPVALNGFPTGTLFINFMGCFFLGWFFTITEKNRKNRPEIRLGIGTGLTGAFSTFSTFSVETNNLLAHNQYVLALTYVLLSVGIGIILTGVGIKIARSRIIKKGEQG